VTARPSGNQVTSQQVFTLLNQFGTYRSGDMADAVNALRGMRKDRILEIFGQYESTGQFDHEVTVTLVCRLLFIPPAEGWGVFELGTDPSSIDLKARSLFPQFPLAVSRNTPVLLVEYFAVFGPGDPEKLLRQAQSLQMITHDLSGKASEEAVDDIVHSQAFLLLYPRASDRAHVVATMMERAKSARE
jgi:hypothetical protein